MMAQKVLDMPRLSSDNVPPGESGGVVGYLDNMLKRRVRAPKQPLKSALSAFRYKIVIRKRFLSITSTIIILVIK